VDEKFQKLENLTIKNKKANKSSSIVVPDIQHPNPQTQTHFGN
jgi:hypothetical protein